jgi:hypothetical protein
MVEQGFVFKRKVVPWMKYVDEGGVSKDGCVAKEGSIFCESGV